MKHGVSLEPGKATRERVGLHPGSAARSRRRNAPDRRSVPTTVNWNKDFASIR
jgi:hypothetical protein